jgi:hypothetical protein
LSSSTSVQLSKANEQSEWFDDTEFFNLKFYKGFIYERSNSHTGAIPNRQILMMEHPKREIHFGCEHEPDFYQTDITDYDERNF